MPHRGGDQRRPDDQSHNGIESDGLDGNMRLIVIHGHIGVVFLSLPEAHKEAVRGKRTEDLEPRLAGSFDGRFDDRFVFFPEEPLLPAVGIQPRNRDAGVGNPQFFDRLTRRLDRGLNQVRG